MVDALKRILYVEDDRDIQVLARLALETVGGFTVEACDSGEEALRRAPVFAPDLVLLDVMMPGMDGPTTLGHLRALPALATVPVVFMTAKAQPQEVAQLRQLGAAGVITKPFDPMVLAERLREIWRQHERQG